MVVYVQLQFKNCMKYNIFKHFTKIFKISKIFEVFQFLFLLVSIYFYLFLEKFKKINKK